MFQQRKGIKMRRLIRTPVFGSVSVLALGIGVAALDFCLNSGADAGNTISAVNMPAASQASDISTTADSLRKDSIRWAQVELRCRGLYKGSLDGVLGPQTTRALSQFQQNNGLTQTASLDAQTWEALTTSPGIAKGSSSVPSDADRSGIDDPLILGERYGQYKRAVPNSYSRHPAVDGPLRSRQRNPKASGRDADCWPVLLLEGGVNMPF